MIRRHESPPESVNQDAAGVSGGAASLHDIERRLAPSGERPEPRQRALTYRRALRRPAARQHRWPLAEVSGDAMPSGVQHWRRRALWGSRGRPRGAAPL